MRLHLLGLVAVYGMGSLACATEHKLLPAGGFISTLGREQPLVGRIWDCARGAYSTSDELLSAVAHARFLALGETHDNPDHHVLQAELLQQFLATHAQPAVGFEMLDEDQAALLAAHPAASSDALASTVNWDASGWPRFALYRPLFDAAFAARARIVATHPSSEHVRASMAGPSAGEARSLALDTPLPAAQREAQREEIRVSHCGHAPEAMLTAMQNAQQYKDAFMARSMFQTHAAAALITGRGHARKDRGVPLYMRRLGVSATLSVGFVDVDATHTRARDYETTAFDFLVFTPRVTDLDPCQQFKQQLETLRHDASAN